MNIKVLIENDKIQENMTTQHGLSLLIESQGQTILFDTGANGEFLRNAAQFGDGILEKVKSADSVVISHHHYDHAGGLNALHRVNQDSPIYVAPLDGKYTAARVFSFLYPNIGIKAAKEVQQRFSYVQEDLEIAPGFRLIRNFETKGFQPPGNSRLYLKPHKGRPVPDDFHHEIALLITEGEKHYLITGCSHSGIGNMIETTKKRYNLDKIDAVFGGFHLMRLFGEGQEDQSLNQLITELEREKETVFYTGHCTGPEAFEAIGARLGDRLNRLNTGMDISL